MTVSPLAEVFQVDRSVREVLREQGYDVERINPRDFDQVLRDGTMPQRHPKTEVIYLDGMVPAPRLWDPREPASAEPVESDGVYLMDLASVEMRDPEWLLRGYLPAGELTMLVGNGGTNKGTFAAHVSAAVTRGEGESQQGTPGYVLWASAEDSIGNILKPRLIAAGADIGLVKPFGVRRHGVKDALCLPEDIAALREAVVALDARLVVIDPLMSHLSGKVDSYRDHDVKRALRPLAQLTNETGCSILGIHHFNKDTSRGALVSSQASGAFGNTARLVLAMAEDDEDDMVRVLEVIKTNISRKGLRKALRVDLVNVATVTELVPVIREDGDTDKSVDELLGGRPAKGAKRADAGKLILRELAEGPKSLDYLKAKGSADLGVSGDTVYRAASGLKADGKVATRNSGPGTPWLWHLVEDAAVTLADKPANPHGQVTSPHTTNAYVSDYGTNSTPDSVTLAAGVRAGVTPAERSDATNTPGEAT